MPPARALLAAALALVVWADSSACELVLRERMAGEPRRELLRASLPASRHFEIDFIHSVLGTPVVDRYQARHAAPLHLVEERFSGQGYGLPSAAGPGEQLQRAGDGWRLLLDRIVDPLVVRPLPSQRMRLSIAGAQWLLADLSANPIEIHAEDCATAQALLR